ncbi:sirohydrochlorin cobaltochelatase [Mariprofundus micogutta]|uniref:Sirohydrochlorin cobaltochelatase n=1 Tax=Mariprofundus micogutta TaxID=1921010 RepID=A0A1L8CL39_9PROT|nr:CbiX/SirB N-terminal domain-containing protein [Mariprofundus micogutta]GAV19621.1 sirohydrochlorin cobaltochelatase [Mariprofundus micogutta]
MKILLAHGSSDANHAKQVNNLADEVSCLLGEEVGAAFLSNERLANGATVLPLFLGAGNHVTEDIPKLVEASNCSLLPSLNEHANALVKMVYGHLTQESKRINVLFALYRFSGFTSLTAAIHSNNKSCSKVAMASMHSEPSVTSVLNHWHADGLKQVTLQPMLLFDGCSLARIHSMIAESSHSDVTLAPVLSEHEGFAGLIANMFREHT